MGEGFAQRNKTEKLTVTALLRQYLPLRRWSLKVLLLYLYHQ